MLETQTTPVKFSRDKDQVPLMANTPNRKRITKKIDKVIAERVDEALWSDKVLQTDSKEIEIYVEEQIVYLRGHVQSNSNLRRVENAINTVPGIQEVKSSLFLDDNLTREVAGALGQIEHVTKVKFFTGVRHGVVTLNGNVDNVTIHSLAERCATGIPGVRGVLNHIRVLGIIQNPEDLRFLQPTIGAQIYFRDGPSGSIKQVIMNPNNRLVYAMVVYGRFSKLSPFYRFGEDREVSSSKLIVIPVRAIRYLTKRSGFLHIKTVESAQYRDFDPKGFIHPKKGWKPPFPYFLENVLFPIEYGETMYPTNDETFHEPLGIPMEASLIREQAFPVTSS